MACELGMFSNKHFQFVNLLVCWNKLKKMSVIILNCTSHQGGLSFTVCSVQKLLSEILLPYVFASKKIKKKTQKTNLAIHVL